MSNHTMSSNVPIKPTSTRDGRVAFNSYQSQQGVALLTILLLVVAITVVAGSMVASQRLSIRQYELLLTQDQLLQDIKVAEKMAMALVAADSKLNDYDSKQDVWAKPIAPASFGNHDIAISIKDASARFNINNLYHDGAVDKEALAAFERLLGQVGLESNLAYAVLDWQDPDSETSPEGGAEIDAYQGAGSGLAGSQTSQTTTSTIGNQPFISVDELMSVKGFTPDAVRKLQPFITAVPYYLPVNVNTADAVVLSALGEGLSAAQMADFTEQMQNTPATSVDNALKQAPWSELEEEPLKKLTPLLAVSSQAFEALIDIAVEDKHRYATTFISKTSDQPPPSQENNAPTMPQNNNDSETPKISAFGTRLWTYRPKF